MIVNLLPPIFISLTSMIVLSRLNSGLTTFPGANRVEIVTKLSFLKALACMTLFSHVCMLWRALP